MRLEHAYHACGAIAARLAEDDPRRGVSAAADRLRVADDVIGRLEVCGWTVIRTSELEDLAAERDELLAELRAVTDRLERAAPAMAAGELPWPLDWPIEASPAGRR